MMEENIKHIGVIYPADTRWLIERLRAALAEIETLNIGRV
jgi:hypothetical protein